MKKYLFFATALAALASCTSNDFVGEDTSSTTNQSEQAAIAFGTGVNSITRADHVGADAADLLGGKFIVEGFKGNGTAMTEVFNNYYVNWTANTAGKTESNTSDWEYVGTAAKAPSTLPSGAEQSIKYWDYSADQYDFAAYSTGKLDAANVLTEYTSSDPFPAGKVLISTITKAETYAGPTYTLKGDVDALKECYISDMVTAYKVNGTDPSDYQKEVQLSFRRLASKVRLAFYETIPGYSVKNVNFYKTDASSNTDISSTVSNTKATLIGTFNEKGTFAVSFPTIGSSKKEATDYNKAHVAFTADASGTASTIDFGTLNYSAAEKKEAAGNVYLERTSAAATYAGTSGDNYYTDVLPNETSGALELRINYQLLSTDGSGEVITVHGAKAFIPAIYARWKPNYAYTYIFKISDNTNGWTSQTSTDPAGLYPITFDAVVVDAEEHTQSTITTVASPSITTYQKGHDVTKDEYAATTTEEAKDSIFIQVMDNGITPAALKNDLDSKGKLYTVTLKEGASDPDGKLTEVEIMDALNIQASSTATAITGRNGWVLTEATGDYALEHADGTETFGAIPGADGNYIPVASGTASRFKAAAGTTYAYVYTISTGTPKNVGIANTYTTKPEGWDTAGNYFKDKDCTIAPDATFKPGIYYQKAYIDNQNAYAVKIIKIAAATVTPGSGS